MKRDNVNYLLVGGFVLMMAAALTVLLLAVTGRSGPSDHYTVEYENVAGLKFGTGVFFEGYRIGQVETIEPHATASGIRYELDLSVQSGWKIPSDSVATVAASGLISAVTIDIHRGQAKTTLQPGDAITGRGQTDLFSVLNQAAADFRTLSQDGIMPVLQNLNGRITEVADELIKFRREELTPLTRRLDQEVISELVAVLKHLDDSARGLQTILGNENQAHVSGILTHVENVAVDVDGLIGRLEATRVQVNGILTAVDRVVVENQGKLAATTAGAQASMRELEVTLKTVNLHLGQILQNLEGGSRNINEFTRTIRDNPARLLRNSQSTEPGQK